MQTTSTVSVEQAELVLALFLFFLSCILLLELCLGYLS